jgi:acetyltransferase-like isoleucine patch superfamily enzyme/acyl carrier protein
MDIWDALQYEILTFLLGPLPGALGLLLRKLFYPSLFGRIGKGVIFGRSVVIRNPSRIVLGDRVVVDDYVVLDGGRGGLRIGDDVIVNRGALIHAKAGPIRIGSRGEIGAEATIISQGAHIIGEMVSVGGGCKIGAALVQVQNDGAPEVGRHRKDFAILSRGRNSKDSIRIGSKSVLEENVIVLHGSTIGSQCILRASATIHGQIPDWSIVAPEERLVVMPRATFNKKRSSVAEELSPANAESAVPEIISTNGKGDVADPQIIALVLRAVVTVNGMLPAGSRVGEDVSSALAQPHGPLDSLGVINLLVAVEDEAELELGRRPNLTEMGTASEDTSVLSTVGSLANFVARRLKNNP